MKNSYLALLVLWTVNVNSQSLPVPDHMVILILENHAYTEIIGNSEAAYINALAFDPLSALFTNSFAIEHPSQPNYLDLFSGCNQGVTTNDVPLDYPFTTDNLGYQLIDAGKSFITYSEDLPSVGFDEASSGDYVRKHNPVANWMGDGINQVPATTNQPFSAFPSDNFDLLPDVSFVVPNQMNNMHDGIVSEGDNWVFNNLSSYIEWAKNNNSLFILTFDEDNTTGTNHITTFFTGQMVDGGMYTENINHYSLLRTLEDMHSLPYACNASLASTITNCWMSLGLDTNDKINFSIHPNPTNKIVHLEILESFALGNVKMCLFDEFGRKVKELSIDSFISDISLDKLPSGLYVYSVERDGKPLKQGKIILQEL